MITSDPMLLLPILAVGWKGFLLAFLVQGIDRSVLSFPFLLQFLLAWESLDLDSQVTLSFHVPFPERHAQPPPRLSNSLPLYHPEAPSSPLFISVCSFVSSAASTASTSAVGGVGTFLSCSFFCHGC